MITPRLSLLDPEDANRFHEASLRLLSEMGVVIEDKTAIEVLDAAGAAVDLRSNIVRIPADVLDKLIHQAPREFVLGGRSGRRENLMGGKELLTRPVVGCLFITDREGKHRRARTVDASKIARLVDAVDEYTWNAAAVYPDDVESSVCDVAYCKILFETTTKHFCISAYTPESLSYMVEMAEAVAGSPEKLRLAPLFNIVMATTSPMKYSKNQVGWIARAGKVGIPVGIASTPLMGATGPVTLAGCIVQMNAENLAGVALSQALNPGAPVYYCSRPTLLDMRTGNSLWGPIEMGMIDAAAIQVARRYQIPSDVLSLRTDAKSMDEQAAYERMSNSLMPALAGVNSIAGAGMLEFVNAVSEEQLVIDAEILTMIRRVVRGIDTDEESMSLEVIEAVGHQGQFLAEQHTRRHHRSEFCETRLADRSLFNQWAQAGGRDIVEAAAERAKSLLTRHEVEPLDPGVMRELESILLSSGKNLG